MKLSEVIINYRNEHGLSQRKFAKQCGLTNSYISMIENEYNPHTMKPIAVSVNACVSIANGMGMSLDELFEECDEFVVCISDNKKNRPERQVVESSIIDSGSSTQDLAPTTEAEQNMLRMFRAMSPEARQTISAMMQTIINIQTASSGDDLNIDIKQNIIPNNTRKESARG